MGAWSHRPVKGEDGKLHFALVRFRKFEGHISGVIGMRNFGETVEAMRSLANELLAACDKGIIDMAGGGDPDADEEDDDEYDEDALAEPSTFNPVRC